MFKGNMSKLLKQAQEMQQKIENAQSQLSEMTVESESGGGMVSVKVNGKQEVLELNIDPDAINEDKDEYLKIIKIMNQENIKTNPSI